MESLTSIRLARIELRCLEKMEEDAAGKPGPGSESCSLQATEKTQRRGRMRGRWAICGFVGAEALKGG